MIRNIAFLLLVLAVPAVAETFDDPPVNLGPASQSGALFNMPTSASTANLAAPLSLSGITDINSYDGTSSAAAAAAAVGQTSNDVMTSATDALVAAVENCQAAMQAQGASPDYCIKAIPAALAAQGDPSGLGAMAIPQEPPKPQMDPMMMMMLMQMMNSDQ